MLRLALDGEIAANAASGCFAAIDEIAIARFRFNQPAPGGPTTLADNSTQETQYNGIYPGHVLKTSYVYNATNQVLQQETPDGRASNFWYDYLSRLVFSQNAKQAALSDYSYTNYDALGRIFEVGQKNLTGDKQPATPYLEDSRYREILNNNTGADSQITQTFYDDKAPGSAGVNVTLQQDNLRKRVSASIYRDNRSTAAINASYYSYDVGGNVKRLYQQINGLGIKTLDYEYDLISGKVNLLAYQHSRTATPEKDQFYYKYDYDSENRLIKAWTSTQANITPYGFGSSLDNSYKRLDAAYQYYLHRPLARMELGRNLEKVQGIDYAYTLQGWLKGVNGTKLDPTIEMGGDAAQPQNATIAKDALAYSLGYYNGDYSPIGGNGAFAHTYVGTNGDLTGRPLFNGNISNSTYSIAKINNDATVGYSYGYDQLNRIKNVNQHDIGIGNWNFGSANDKFKESFGYDGNGNILTLQRNNQGGSTMDNLGYVYNRDGAGKLLNNRLAAVNDAVGVTNGNDIGNNSYTYDEIGNLKTDAAEGISNIDWSVYGKIKSISKNSGGINYTYDPSGNRVSKLYNGITTYYVRDAQGNSLAVYDNTGNTSNWREQQLYGSSRLGMWKPSLNLATANGSSIWNSYGLKFFELSNHLGNVMAVVSDNRLQNGSTYEPDVINSNDYYAFGGQMNGRDFTNPGAQAYRYGFNGKENDNEVKGTGNQQDYGMRIYDPRIGKFLSVDPITSKYPELTPYQFASNRPIDGVDMDGLEYLNTYINGVASRRDAALKRGDYKEAQRITESANAQAMAAILVFDAFYTKGRLTQLITGSQFFSAFDHNQAKTSEGRAQQNKESWNNIGQSLFGWGLSKIIGTSINVFRGPVKEEINYLFRGTSEGYEGNRVLQQHSITPTSSDPVVSTIFAINGKEHGKGILQIASLKNLQGVSVLEGNVFQSLEKEVPLGIRPVEFTKRAGITITAEESSRILNGMGIKLPSRIGSPEALQEALKNSPRLNGAQINEFYKQASKIAQ